MLSTMRLMGVLVAALFSASCTSSGSLLVQLVSDMSPGREIDLAVVSLDGIDSDGSPTPIPRAASLGRPVRLASFASVGAGRHTIRVTLRLGDREVLSRAVVRDVEGSTIVTVLMTRDCAGIVCPGSGSPTAIACLGGQCVEPGCDEEHPELCPTPECHVDGDCMAMSTVACAPQHCSSSGICFSRPDDALCAPAQLCDGQLGCVAVGSDAGPPPTDGGLDAAPNVDAGDDAGSDAGRDAGVPTCPVGQHRLAGICRPSLDVNGDGFADLVIGAQAYMSMQGRADLYLGGAAGLTLGGTFLHGVAGERIGFTVIAAGDTNGDGLDDFIVSGHNVAPSHGYLIFGRPSYTGGAITPDVELPNAELELSQFMSSVGDVDGDGLADVVLGRDGAPVALYLYRGRSGSGLPMMPDDELGVADIGNLFGGDLDGDGRGDLLATGPLGGASEHVRVFLSRGGVFGTTPDATLLCPEASASNFGPSAVVDVDGDGIDDLVVGASGGTSGVYVFRGRAGLTPGPSPRNVPLSGRTAVGQWLTSLGDIDLDGYGDVALTADGLRSVVVARGGASGLAVTMTSYMLPSRGGRTQVRLTAADFDGDGEVDLAVGDPAADSVYVIRGPLTGMLSETWTIAPGVGGFGGSLSAR